MRKCATVIGSNGWLGEIFVNDIWEHKVTGHFAKIEDYNGQWFDVTLINPDNTLNGSGQISNFEDFLKQWKLFDPSPDRVPQSTHQAMAAAFAGWGKSGVLEFLVDHQPALKKSNCECGGHKAGFKDYTRQHSSWCPVYKE